jgi:outer membrane lipoprotein-sorting protein
MKKYFPITVLILLLSPLIIFAEALPPTAVKTLHQTLRETYEKMSDLEADFSQSVIFEGFDAASNSKGKVYFKRGDRRLRGHRALQGEQPLQGKMRWDYASPTRQQIFVNGETVLHYMPENKQVLLSVLAKETGLPIDLFFSIEKIEALFHISQIKENTLLLKPKENGSHITQMMLTLAPLPNGPFITEIRLFEENGNQSVFQFSNFRINTALSEQFFSFKIPEGVEVIDFTQNPQ